MSAIVLLSHNSTGHGCFAPTTLVSTSVNNVRINGTSLAVVGDQYSSHRCGKVTHAGGARGLASGSGSVFAGGKAICRVGDSIVCGDYAGQGSQNVFAGG